MDHFGVTGGRLNYGDNKTEINCLGGVFPPRFKEKTK